MYSSKLGHGGGSGYYHLCPGNFFHRNAEGSFRVGGDYSSSNESYDAYAAGASYAANSGNWRVEQTQNGLVAKLVAGDGNSWEFQVSDIQNGRWRRGHTKFFAEVGKAKCQ